MTALRPAALLRHRLAVWLLAALTLWGAFSPTLMRAQAASAGMPPGMEVCSAMLGGTQVIQLDLGADSSPDAEQGLHCARCMLALNLAQALPARALAVFPPALSHGAPIAHGGVAWVPGTWVMLPPPRGPPLQLL